jgi:Clostripain family
VIKRAVGAAASLAVVATLAGASGAAAPAAPAKAADWTIMVYAVGDTSNVSQLMVENLSQLAALPDADNVNVVVMLDLPERSDPGAPTSTLPGLDQFTTAKLLQLDGNRFNEIRDLGEVAMGRPDALASFIEEAADRFPAQKYALSLFDHGGGNTGGYLDTGPPGTTVMTIPDIRAGMAAGMARAGIDRFDLLFHAACLMSSYETASALAPLAETMAGSEELMIQYPLSPEGFAPLAQNRSGEEVGRAFIDGYGHLLDEIATQGGQTYRDLAAMSVVGGDEIQRLDAAMESFAGAAVANMDEIATEVGRARSASLEFIVGYGESSGDLIDLGDFLRNLEGLPPDVEVARDAAFAALQSAVSAQVLGRATEQATGLNVFLPTDPRRVGDYLTDGTAPKGWGEFVTAFLEKGVGGTAQGGGVAFVDDEADVLLADQTGIKIAGQLTSGSAALVTGSETQVYTALGGQDRALAVALPAYVNAGGEGQVQGVWNYALTTLSDGGKSIPVSTGFQAQSGGLIGSMLAQYTSPEGDTSDVGIRVLLSSEGQIESVSLVDVTSGQAGGIELATGGKLTPYLFVPQSGALARELSSQSIAVSDALQVAFTRLKPGTSFDMGVLVADVQGNTAAAFTTQRVR